jgi:hypothetical protein
VEQVDYQTEILEQTANKVVLRVVPILVALAAAHLLA